MIGLIIPCSVLDCKHNDKDEKHSQCTTAPKISRDAKCYSVETDMGYLRGKWVYVKGSELVKSHKAEFHDRAVSGELRDE